MTAGPFFVAKVVQGQFVELAEESALLARRLSAVAGHSS